MITWSEHLLGGEKVKIGIEVAESKAKKTANIYPKAKAPLTEVVLDMANARADRWLQRYRKAVQERYILAARVKELEEDATR